MLKTQCNYLLFLSLHLLHVLSIQSYKYIGFIAPNRTGSENLCKSDRPGQKKICVDPWNLWDPPYSGFSTRPYRSLSVSNPCVIREVRKDIRKFCVIRWIKRWGQWYESKMNQNEPISPNFPLTLSSIARWNPNKASNLRFQPKILKNSAKN